MPKFLITYLEHPLEEEMTEIEIEGDYMLSSEDSSAVSIMVVDPSNDEFDIEVATFARVSSCFRLDPEDEELSKDEADDFVEGINSYSNKLTTEPITGQSAPVTDYPSWDDKLEAQAVKDAESSTPPFNCGCLPCVDRADRWKAKRAARQAAIEAEVASLMQPIHVMPMGGGHVSSRYCWCNPVVRSIKLGD